MLHTRLDQCLETENRYVLQVEGSLHSNTLARLIDDLTKFFKLYTKGRQIIDENSPATSEKAQQNTMLILLQVGFLSVLVISSCLSGHIY